jgi:hypothetical protein
MSDMVFQNKTINKHKKTGFGVILLRESRSMYITEIKTI